LVAMLNRAKWQMSPDVSRFHVAASPSDPEKTEWELNEDLAFVAILGIPDHPKISNFQLINVLLLNQLHPAWRNTPYFLAWNRSRTILIASGEPPIPGASSLVGVPDRNSPFEDYSNHYRRS
jgi:hypothetical protein